MLETKQKQTLVSSLFSVLIPLLFSLFILFLNHRYFFIDDKISETLAKLYDIGGILRQGDFPSLTTNIMNGGAYAAEYQFSIFNPIHLILCYLLPSFSNYAVAAWFLSAVYLMLTGFGSFLLGRNLNLSNSEALALSSVISLNFHVLHWNASIWLIALVGSCWVVFGLAFLSGFLYQKRSVINQVGLFIAFSFCITSGWPLAILVIAFSSLFILLHLVLIQRDYFKSGILVSIGVASVLVSSASLFPLFSISEVSTRFSGITNHNNFLVAPLDALIAFSDPGYQAFFHSWKGYTSHKAPTFYVAWFLLAIVFITDWSAQKLKQTGGWIWGALALVFMLAAMGPEALSYIRFPIRFAVYFNFFLAIFLMFSWKHSGFKITKNRQIYFFIALLVQAIHSFQASPSNGWQVLIYTLIIAILSYVFFKRLKKKTNQGIYLLVTSLFILGLVMNSNQNGRGVDWGFPENAEATVPLGRTNYTLFYGSYVDSSATPNPHLEYRIATTGMLAGDRTINGYSPIGHKGFRNIMHISDHGNFEPNGLSAEKLFEVDKKTGLTHAQLMKIDRIIALKDSRARDIEAHLPGEYSLVNEKSHTRVYDYNREYNYPGLISWVSPQTKISNDPACNFKHHKECIDVIQTPEQGGEILFARLWFPGYRAFINKVEIDVSPHKFFWVRVSLPPSAQGKLELIYVSPGFQLGVFFAVIGFLLFIGTVLFYKKHYS